VDVLGERVAARRTTDGLAAEGDDRQRGRTEGDEQRDDVEDPHAGRA
jgi:hypothetical protein